MVSRRRIMAGASLAVSCAVSTLLWHSSPLTVHEVTPAGFHEKAEAAVPIQQQPSERPVVKGSLETSESTAARGPLRSAASSQVSSFLKTIPVPPTVPSARILFVDVERPELMTRNIKLASFEDQTEFPHRGIQPASLITATVEEPIPQHRWNTPMMASNRDGDSPVLLSGWIEEEQETN